MLSVGGEEESARLGGTTTPKNPKLAKQAKCGKARGEGTTTETVVDETKSPKQGSCMVQTQMQEMKAGCGGKSPVSE